MVEEPSLNIISIENDQIEFLTKHFSNNNFANLNIQKSDKILNNLRNMELIQD